VYLDAKQNSSFSNDLEILYQLNNQTLLPEEHFYFSHILDKKL